MTQRGGEFCDEQYASIFPTGIERHYWHRGRNRIVARKLLGYVSRADVLFDLGCGAGVLVAHLRASGLECQGADLGRPSYVVPGARGHVHLGRSAFELPVELRSRVSVLMLMDVLEHLPDATSFLDECATHFPGVRLVFVTVPAREEIWSEYDEYNRHYRRYSLESLRDLRVPDGFALRECGYFFHLLYWAARVHHGTGAKRATSVRAPRGSMLHGLLGRAFDWEERVTPGASRGSSAYGIYSRAGFRLSGSR